MGKLTRITNINELTEGTMKKYQVQGTEVMIVRVEGKYYAAQNKCPHFGGDLSKGKLEGTTLTCPRHGSQFNLTDGSVVRWLGTSRLLSMVSRILKPPKPVRIYTVRVEDSRVLVEV